MNTAKILSALDDELARLRQVRDLLAGQASDEDEQPRRRGRRPGPQSKAVGRPPATAASAKPARKKRVLSEEARQRIAEAQKRRWAASKRNAE